MATSSNKRIAKNTLMLYIRMFISMAISLFTSRIILRELGVSDYGVYNVVGGVVALISFLNASMSGATTRFLTYEQENKDKTILRKTFGSSLIIHLALALVIVVILETVGLWFLCKYIDIPSSSWSQALWVYQFSIASTFFSIIKVPYNAAIIAHEKMSIYAYIEILGSVFNLGIALLLIIIANNKLILYSALQSSTILIITLFYILFCIRNFPECSKRIIIDRKLFRPMFSFFGWDLYGNLSTIARGQGVNILMNMFFGVSANTAYGISNQIQSAVGSFSANIVTAVKPQIIKSYAANEYQRMITLIYSSSKLIYVLLLLISLPLLLEMFFVLELWLGEVPQYTVWFARLTVAFLFLAAMSTILVTGVHATGDIRRPSFINGSIYLSVVPISYLAYKLGFSIYLPLMINVVFVFIGCLVNLITLKKFVVLISIKTYLIHVIFPCLFASFISFIPSYVVHSLQLTPWIRFISVLLTSAFCVVTASYFIVATKEERKLISFYIKSIIKKKWIISRT